MNKTLKNVLYVFVADILVKVVSASTTFVVARLLSPAEYGTWITLILVVSYAPIASLGTVETLLKQFPFYSGRGDVVMARRIEAGVLGSILLAAGALLLGGLSLSFLLETMTSSVVNGMVRTMLLTASLSLISAFFYYRFSAHQKFRFVSMIDAARAIATFACLVALTWRWGLSGTVGGMLAAELLICGISGWLCVTQCGRLAASVDMRLICDMVRIGLPITVIWWTYIIQSSADRLISISMLGEAATGYYGLGLSIVSLLVLLPTTLSRVLYPRVNEKIGQTSRDEDLRGIVVLPAQALSILIPLAIGLLVILSPFVYRQLLPKYGPGLLSAQILLIGSFFACIVRNGANFLIATNRQHAVLKYVLISLSVNVTGNVALAKAGFGIEGIAFGSSVSGFVLASLVWLDVFRRLGHNGRERYTRLGSLYLPYGIMVLLLALYAALVPDVFAVAAPRLLLVGGLFLGMFAGLLYATPAIRSRSILLVGLFIANLKGRAAA